MLIIWDKVFKSGLSKFFKGCLPQKLLSPLLNTLSHILSIKVIAFNVTLVGLVVITMQTVCKILFFKSSNL